MSTGRRSPASVGGGWASSTPCRCCTPSRPRRLPTRAMPRSRRPAPSSTAAPTSAATRRSARWPCIATGEGEPPRMKVVVVAEFYPRAADPVLGSWAHAQAVAARDAGAEVRVLVLDRPVPPRSTLRQGGAAGAARAAIRALRQPRHATLDGIEVTYVPFVSPARSRSYGSWGAWAAPSLALALRGLRRRFGFDLVHAHYAVPAADAVLRTRAAAPLVVSEHGGDLYHTAPASDAGRAAVERAFARARVVLANSAAVAERCRGLGAREVRVVHLGTDVPPEPAPVPREPVIASVGHLVARKRHADVVRALWLLRDRHPDLRYVVVGAGPEREGLGRLASDLGLDGRVEFLGQLPPPAARD